MDWSPGQIILSRDGKVYVDATSRNLTPWPFDNNGGSYILLNIATNGTGTNGQAPIPSSMPVKMLVDYVRVWT